MLNPEVPPPDLWCPIDENANARLSKPQLDMTPADWAALSRASLGEWVSDKLIERLESLGLIEKVFGQPLLTRLGRVTLGIPG
jgi:hypothetical protein